MNAPLRKVESAYADSLHGNILPDPPVVAAGLPRWIVEFILRCNDLLMICIAGLMALYAVQERIPMGLDPFYIKTSVIGACVAALFFEWRFTYHPDAHFDFWLASRRLVSGMILATLSFLVVAFTGHFTETYSRLWLGTWILLSALLVFGGRALLSFPFSRMRDSGVFDTRVAIVGIGLQGKRLLQHLQQSRGHHLNVLGYYDDRVRRYGQAGVALPVLGTVDNLIASIRRNEIDQVIIALPWVAEARVKSLVQRLAMTPVAIRLAPDLAAYNFTDRGFSLLDGLPVLNLFDRPISGFDQFIKSVEDRLLAGLFTLLLLPLMLVIAIAIKIDSRGPVFFRQKREGFNNHPIHIWKFRSMRTDLCEADNVTQARRDDHRVTRVGALLRRTSLDELPQLFNVLAGQMSIVGPRPHVRATKVGQREFHMVVDNYAERHKVKPGITGWAQVNGWRGETDTEDKLRARLEHDLYYIDHWSLLFDFYIILRTMLTVFAQKNAY